MTAPEVLDYADDGISFVYFDKNQGNVEIPGELVELEANDGCPSSSIKVSNMPFMVIQQNLNNFNVFVLISKLRTNNTGRN
ncbi:ferredoxin [Neobacillus cucumis]|uniref:ferredoxin n=1 Tax=Neobacillus cucumis TaxID=1740721 RepID=UPI0035A84826